VAVDLGPRRDDEEELLPADDRHRLHGLGFSPIVMAETSNRIWASSRRVRHFTDQRSDLGPPIAIAIPLGTPSISIRSRSAVRSVGLLHRLDSRLSI
jgi:hypothetical protein